MEIRKVLILGVDENVIGGVSTVNRILLNSKYLREKYSISILKTSSDNSKINYFLKAFFNVRRISNDVDLVHIDLSSNGSCYRKLILSRMIRKTPYILHIHSGNFLEFYLNSNIVIKCLIKRMFLDACKICCVSKTYVDRVIKVFNLPEDKVSFVYNGVDVKEHKFNKDKEKTNILFFGALINNRCIQDYLDLAKTFKNIPSVIFNVAGPGKGYDWDNFGVEYYGIVEGNEKEELLTKTDILINGFYYESFGIGMIECMNHGACVVGRDSCSIPEIITNGKEGVIFDDYSQVGSIITELVENKDKLGELQNNAYKKSFEYSIESFEINMREFYDGCFSYMWK